MTREKVNVQLNQKEIDFVKWLAKQDGISTGEELGLLLKLQVQETMQVYIDGAFYQEGDE